MKSMTKTVKVNSLSLARAAAQFWTKIEFDLHPLLQDKALAETIEKINSAIGKLEDIVKQPEKSNPSELSSEFHKTDKALEKVKTKVNDLQTAIEKIEKALQEKLAAKLDILRKTDPKDATDTENRNKVEIHMKSIKNLLATAKNKLQEIQKPAEAALKRMHAIKPKLYALGITDNFDRCQKRAEKLNEDIGELCYATAEMISSDLVIAGAALLFKDAAPTKLFLPKLQNEIEKSSKLLQQVGQHLGRLLQVVPMNAGDGNHVSDAARLHVNIISNDVTPKLDQNAGTVAGAVAGTAASTLANAAASTLAGTSASTSASVLVNTSASTLASMPMGSATSALVGTSASTLAGIPASAIVTQYTLSSLSSPTKEAREESKDNQTVVVNRVIA